MPGETIDSTFASGLILTTLQTNPVVFAATNTIVQTASTALYSNIAYTWTIQNAGLIQSVSGTSGSAGIVLSAASIANTTTGRISGYNAGIYISGTGTVSNQGTIQSTDATGNGYTYTTVDNTATIVSAAVILGQGSIDNAAGGLISGALGGVGTDR